VSEWFEVISRASKAAHPPSHKGRVAQTVKMIEWLALV